MKQGRRGEVKSRTDPYEQILKPSPRRLKWSFLLIALLLAAAIAWESAFAIVTASIMFVAGLWALWLGR
jgi:hypothetical protein